MRLSLALTMLTLALSGCADDNISVYVRGNIAPEQSDDGCLYSASSSLYVTQGLWDITGSQRYSGEYKVNLAVVNQIRARASSVAAEPNGVHITGAEVTLRQLGGEPFGPGVLGGLPNPFSVPASAFISPAAGPGAPGLSTVTVVVVPVGYAAALIAQGVTETTIVGSIRLTGETSGHIDVRTGEWDYPIAICAGCLFTCPPTADDALLACDPGVNQPSADPSHPSCL